MADSSATLHEPVDRLCGGTVDRHRALVSLMEELEAIDWYAQRIDATEDEELRSILAHNSAEEKEHAALLLEWIRRRDPVVNANLKKYLFTTNALSGLVESEEGNVAAAPPDTDGSLEIGGLKGGKR